MQSQASGFFLHGSLDSPVDVHSAQLNLVQIVLKVCLDGSKIKALDHGSESL